MCLCICFIFQLEGMSRTCFVDTVLPSLLSICTIILQVSISVAKGEELKNNTKATYEKAQSLLDFIRGSMKDIEGWGIMIISLSIY